MTTEETPDGLDPPGVQLGLFPPDPVAAVHRVGVFSSGFLFYWSCACGQSGVLTTNGRAYAGAAAHMRGARRRAAKRPEKP